MKPRLLISESDEVLRNIYERLFRNLGYELETARHGLECIDKLRHWTPDILVIDWQMPWGGGDGVLDYVRHSHHRFPPDVILVTCASASKLAEHCAPPVVACLEKPFRMSALIDAICRRDQRHVSGADIQRMLASHSA